MKRIIIFLFLSPLSLSFAAASPEKENYDDCNWMVTYRGKTYDLAPLTRESLARSVESDMRPILQRVPKAETHLQTMTTQLKEARAHTMIASAFISSLLITRLIRSGEKNIDRRETYDILTAVSAMFFLKATYESWNSTHNAKLELVRAVNSFNEKSPHKIDPVTSGKKLENENAEKN